MNLAECFLFLSLEVPATMGAKKIINENYPESSFFSASSISKFCELFRQKNEALSACLIDFEINLYEELIQITSEFIMKYPGISFVYLLRSDTNHQVVIKLMDIGVKGLLLKAATSGQIIHCIKEVLQGRDFVQREIVDSIKGMAHKIKKDVLGDPFGLLSNKELQVVNRLLNGMRGDEIAADLNINRATVATYLLRAKRKLQINSLIDLLDLANKFHHKKII